jgi:enamine deaminase RidA (YjgF/YER057c/UK114 family)
MTNQKVCLDQSKYNSIIQNNLKLRTKINDINISLRKSNKVACDEECQAAKLKQAYIDSQYNLLAAPQQEQTAYKNYVVFTQGETGYTEQETQQFTEEANNIADEIMTNFETTAMKIGAEIDSYDALLINYKNVLELYKKYLKENKYLIKKLKTDYSDVITNDRKTYYEDQGVDNLNFYYYYILLIIYIIVFICFGVFAFGYPSPMGIPVKIAILAGLFILPFISTMILNLIIETLHKIYNLLPKNSYKNI